MFDNNEFKDVNYSQVENPMELPSKKNGKAFKIVAFILSVAIVGGASGFGGSYLSNYLNDKNALSVTEDVDVPIKTVLNTEKDSETDAVVENLINSDSSASGKLTTAQAIKKATDSVVSVSSKFSSGSGTGTGIIMTSDGYIITNAHVVEAEVYIRNNNSSPFGSFEDFFGGGSYPSATVEKASEVTITTASDKEYKAEIIGVDSATDLAVLKIKASGLTPVDFGSSENLIMGERAISLGYPLGMGLSASEGIISGLNKEMTIELAGGGSADMTLIQTDAAINPGNSGGPLLNEYGQVIGITSSKIVSSSIEGIGFAIPISDALPLLQELMDKGYVTNTTPKIGITGQDINSSVQRYYGLPVSSGVLVVTVESGSSADKAGISEGDVIVGADGKEISAMDELIKIKDSHSIGDTMVLTLARESGNVDIEITLGGQN